MYSDRSLCFIHAIGTGAICLVLCASRVIGCSDESAARRALAVARYHDVTILGAGDFCGPNASTCTAFAATTADGRRHHGAVACTRDGCGERCAVQLGGR